MAATSRSMLAREGRENQIYCEDGRRVVCGTVVLNEDNSKLLVVSSEAHPEKWVLPKGGAEKDESLEESALRETWEEAGAIGKIGQHLGIFNDTRSQYHFWEMHIGKLEDEWPEKYKRRRQWMTREEAHSAMLANGRVSLAEVIEQSIAVGARTGQVI